MRVHRVTAPAACTRCAAGIETVYTARSTGDGLRCATTSRCPTCGLAVECDDDALTEAARAAFVREEGRWSVVLTDLGAHRSETFAALRALLGASPAEVIAIAHDRRRIFEGALVEAESVARRLTEKGASVSIVPTPHES